MLTLQAFHEEHQDCPLYGAVSGKSGNVDIRDGEAQASVYGSCLTRKGKIEKASGDAPRSNAKVIRVVDAFLASVPFVLRWA